MEAEALQKPPAQAVKRNTEVITTNQFVTFICGNQAFGIDIMSVREIRSWSPTTELPSQPHGAKGVLDIRGSVVQVYDLSLMLGSGGCMEEENGAQVVLVVALDNEEVGLLVDSVSDIIFAQQEDMRPVPASHSAHNNKTVSGLVRTEERLIAVLNLQELFPHLSEETF